MKSNDILTALYELQELFADEHRWTKGEPARDKYGNQIGITSPEAVCWCFVGGIDRVVGEDYHSVTKYSAISRALVETIDTYGSDLKPVIGNLVAVNELGKLYPDRSGRLVTGYPAVIAVIADTILRYRYALHG